MDGLKFVLGKSFEVTSKSFVNDEAIINIYFEQYQMIDKIIIIKTYWSSSQGIGLHRKGP